jgi:CheY-like chemotaxis protein
MDGAESVARSERGSFMTNEPSEPFTVLVIDEDANVLDATRAALAAAGYRVLTRDRSAGSVAVIIKEKPDVVLAELNMTRITGETIARIINKTQPRPNAAVLLHSALPIETLRLKALAAGAQGYVQKSDQPGELVQRIDQYVTAAKSTSKNRLLASLPLDDGEPASPFERLRAAASNPDGTAGEATLVGPRDGAGRAGVIAAIGAHGGRVSAVGESPPVGVPRAGPLRTLFVDDDWSLLRSYRTTIGPELQAEFLTSGEEAIHRILSDSPPDIVVCDIVMPFVTGADVYSRAVATDPLWRQRFLFLTGASSTRVVVDFLNEHEGRVLFKPVPSNRLLDTIRKMESNAARRAPAFR